MSDPAATGSASDLGSASVPRIVVLASGGGTNCQALIDACHAGELVADVVAVITNNAHAGVVERARNASVPVQVVDHASRTPEGRAQDDARLIAAIDAFEPDLVVLAGWMRILGADVGSAFPIVNLHPAKPGEFPGTRAIERAFQAWTAGEIHESGVMVHWVPDDGVDVGPVIATEVVRFEPGDDLAAFAARVHTTEHQLIVAAVRHALADAAGADGSVAGRGRGTTQGGRDND